ncbi:autoinducer-2 (AI-2) modifying protein LsrG [Shinella sp. AETb1-6]|jgi:autoinducer 2-degrading protein|uniref:Antibiotic biosynthesis monooxygenase n=2 Tax=Shinella TaxID=323620 RepID=A0AA50CKN2_9HYPH|nr:MULTISPECIES: antibiotic biosynthesis monooxygenase [Shinella]MDP9589289.1 autoinducer 2-degrading protein [Shinella zoogloeoides]MCD1264375.1 autoinducer-2 (AI-2) modifying protein LsrG [Shinella sumterensis]MXN52651.1 autoinducer-2 (AI-2) modifying protein LsrG [Shinella sp. AETb1-6]TFE98988.1 autoinducer-2 (AI-2) modifying protein LsrG [Shinella sumterensis]WLR97150.1 antibiotic biosynthesis monooxygenase [Shinella sumterensis]
MLIQMVSINVKPGHAAEFLEAFRINYEGTRQEPGNVRFDVLRNPEDENSFTIYEVFTSPEAVDEHRKTAHYQECVRRIDPILAGPRTKTFYQVEMADFLGE